MTTASTSAASQPLLDLQALVVSVRRRRRLWLTTAVLGLLAGALFAFLLPSPPTAVVLLTVSHENDGPSNSDAIETDAALLSTARIAAAALKTLNATERPEDFLTRYKALPLTNNVLRLTVTGTSQADAIARAQAIADVFIADHLARAKENTDAQAQAIVNQRNNAQAELVKVDEGIAAAAAGGGATSTPALQSLYARRAELGAQIADLGQRAVQAGIGLPRIGAGTRIVDPPRFVRESILRKGAVNTGAGLLLGLAAGLTFAAITSVVRDRPVLRRDIAAHLGASVIAQLPARRRGPASWLRRSRAVKDRKRVAATLVRIIREHDRDSQGALGADLRDSVRRPIKVQAGQSSIGVRPSASVSVLELGCSEVSAALSQDIAEGLATDGPVVIVNDLTARKLRRLRVKAEGPIRVVTTEERASELPAQAGSKERQIGLGSVAPGTTWTDIEQLGTKAVLLVRAGHASTAWLHAVARHLTDSSVQVIGVVLVDPDPWDRTDGTLWEDLHAALRGEPTTGARSTFEVVAPATRDIQEPESAPAPTTNGVANVNKTPRVRDRSTERSNLPMTWRTMRRNPWQQSPRTRRALRPTQTENGEVS